MASSNRTTLGETFDVLTHPHRRYVLYYLRTHSEVADIDTLTAMLAKEGPSTTGGSDTTARIEVALQHTHLPKLADAGLITVAPDRESIALDGMNGHGHFIDEAARADGYAASTLDNFSKPRSNSLHDSD